MLKISLNPMVGFFTVYDFYDCSVLSNINYFIKLTSKVKVSISKEEFLPYSVPCFLVSGLYNVLILFKTIAKLSNNCTDHLKLNFQRYNNLLSLLNVGSPILYSIDITFHTK